MLFAALLLVLLACDLIDCFAFGETPTHWRHGIALVIVYAVAVLVFRQPI